MLQGWSLLAAIFGGAYLLSHRQPAGASGRHSLPPGPVRFPGAPPAAAGTPWGRWDPGQIQPSPFPPTGPAFLGPPVHPPSQRPVMPTTPLAPVPAAATGMWKATPILYNPTQDPGNAAHPTSAAMLPRPADPVAVATSAAANATPAQLRRIPDTATPPPVGDWWAPATAAGRGAMPWDPSHVPVVQAIAPPPVPRNLDLPTPSLGPGRSTTGRHVPPPPPVARDPVGPTRTSLLPWDHPIAGPRMPELTGTKVPVTDAPRGAAAWYGTPAASPGVLSSAAGMDPGVTKVPTILQTIAQLLGPIRNPLAPTVSGPVAGSLPRASAPW